MLLDRDDYLDVDRPWSGLTNRRGNLATRSSRVQMMATRLGMSVEVVELQIEAGNRWCSGHGRWCPSTDFGGTKGSCRAGHAEYMRARNAARKAG